jgi:hypothetical protein
VEINQHTNTALRKKVSKKTLNGLFPIGKRPHFNLHFRGQLLQGYGHSVSVFIIGTSHAKPFAFIAIFAFNPSLT